MPVNWLHVPSDERTMKLVGQGLANWWANDRIESPRSAEMAEILTEDRVGSDAKARQTTCD